ncbi:hypothetical protein KFE98_21340 [bacterium SCSIO 12741]|nr:hypothetical protein KFE98_21340 [bacterium SCSIO 12741]
MKTYFRIFGSLLGLVWLTSACNNPNPAPGMDVEMQSLTDSASDRLVHELGAVRKNIEQSATLYTRLNAEECPYNPGLAVEPERNHNTSNAMAFGFGELGAKFVYTASYGQTQHANEYLAQILDLSEKMGIRQSFNEEQLRQLALSDPEIDKSAILTKAYLRATDQLYTEERAVMVSYMVLGGWIEGMSLSYEICGEYLEDDNIRLGLYDQTYGYYNCIRLLKAFDSNETTHRSLELMLELEPLMERVVQSRGVLSRELFTEVKESIENLESQMEELWS